MLKTIKYYLNIYKSFVLTSLAVKISFRTNFVLLILLDLFFYASTIFSIKFIFMHIETIGPWTENQLLFFMSYMLLIDTIHMGLISEAFWTLSDDIRTGALDFIILKPASSLFSVFLRFARPSSLATLPLAIGILIYFGLKVDLTIIDWILIPPFIILSLTLLVVIEVILATFNFWLIEGFGLNFLRMQLQQLARWPYFIYGFAYQKLLIFGIPLLLIGSGPVQFLFDKKEFSMLLIMLPAIIILFTIMVIFWNFALRRYDSASS